MVPAVRSEVDPLSRSLLAGPATTVTVIGFPVPAANGPPEPVADALIVTEPS